MPLVSARKQIASNSTLSLQIRRLFLCFGLLLLLPMAGCQRIRALRAPEPAARITIALDKQAYRPGEPVKIHVVLANASRKPISIRELDALSVAFFYSRQGDPEPMERRAVFSRTEPMGGIINIDTSATKQRDFLLTRLTYYSGPMQVVAIYDPNGADAGGKPAPKINSNVIKYTVSGEQMFAREPNSGLITSENAKALAAAAARKAGHNGAEAAGIVSVQDEKDFDKWWVNVRAPGADGIDQLTGWFVSPYTGVVHQTRVPFSPSMAADKHIIDKSSPKKLIPRTAGPKK